MTESEPMSDRDVDELLPWYVNGTLDGEEKRAVEAYVERSEQARAQVAFLSRVRETVRGEQSGSPGNFGLARLRAAINASVPAQRRQGGRWRMVAAAAGVVVIIQAGVLLRQWQEAPVYRPLGADGGAVLQVSFREDATEAEIRALLNGIGATIRSGPGSLGVYRLSLDEGVDAGEALSALRAETAVVSEANRN